MPTIVSVADLRKELGPVLESAHHDGPVMVSKRDRPYASVVSHKDGQLVTDLRQAAAEHQMDYEDFKAVLREMISEKLGDPDNDKAA